MDRHGVLGNRSRLIHTQHIDSGKCFDALHIVKQYLLLGKTHGTDRQRNSCQQIQSLWNHTDHCRYHRSHTALERIVVKEKALHYQNNTNRNDRNTDPFDQLIQCTDHL